MFAADLAVGILHQDTMIGLLEYVDTPSGCYNDACHSSDPFKMRSLMSLSTFNLRQKALFARHLNYLCSKPL